MCELQSHASRHGLMLHWSAHQAICNAPLMISQIERSARLTGQTCLARAQLVHLAKVVLGHAHRWDCATFFRHLEVVPGPATLLGALHLADVLEQVMLIGIDDGPPQYAHPHTMFGVGELFCMFVVHEELQPCRNTRLELPGLRLIAPCTACMSTTAFSAAAEPLNADLVHIQC